MEIHPQPTSARLGDIVKRPSNGILQYASSEAEAPLAIGVGSGLLSSSVNHDQGQGRQQQAGRFSVTAYPNVGAADHEQETMVVQVTAVEENVSEVYDQEDDLEEASEPR